MAASGPDYGAAGRVGVLVPGENPAVEPELAVLFGPDVAMLTSRMSSPEPAMTARLCDYGRGLTRWMSGFGGVGLDAVAFACTGTSYLLAEALPDVWRDGAGRAVPLITAAGAVESAMAAAECKQVALVSPYPQDLTDAALSYWRGRGLKIVSVAEPAKSAAGYHPIYVQTAAAIARAIEAAASSRPDAVVVLGTGAPSLAAIVRAQVDVAVLSSNLCLGWATSVALGGAGPADIAQWTSPDAPWRERLRLRFPAAVAGVPHRAGAARSQS